MVLTLFHQLADERRQRLLGKFAEEGLVKTTRLLKLRAAYDERVAVAEARVTLSLDEDEGEGEDEEGATPEERIYLARVEAGLQTLHTLDTIVGYVATARNKPLRVAILQGLYEQGRSLHDVWASIDEHDKLFSDGARPDKTRDKQLGAMGEAVRALLATYSQPTAAAGEASAAGSSADAS